MLNNTVHSWLDGYFKSISVCGVRETRVGVQNLQEGASYIYIYIHLNYFRVEYLSCIKKLI